MRDEEVHGLLADLDRHVPVALGREPDVLELVRRVPVGRRGSPGRRAAGRRACQPTEALEGPDRLGVDRVPRVDDHAVLAGEQPEPEGVVAAPDRPVVVEVVSARDPGVGRRPSSRGRDRPQAVLRRPRGIWHRKAAASGSKSNSLTKTTSGRPRWMTSATFFSLPPVDVVDVRRGEMLALSRPCAGTVERRVERREAHGLPARRGRGRLDLTGLPGPGRGWRGERRRARSRVRRRAGSYVSIRDLRVG